ncbi:hypothetical protein M3P05_01255 [Sansalvadorimonas sp. 2012CJ34-2]|uniref:Uncharacterized protein n=1 Tax=Parendozoicomonas callyspongiae TaxID=2942213 RepID=A0ABT0PB27_9GAMM|nr:hypothetical protein [Sansalvadorimonas sp. 2012CJ34-2]MCL6268580.1 hypothetical protein [Sansalvadorimonas sp. 2012CJ34-2]
MKNNIKNYFGCLSLCLATAGVQANGDIHDLMDCTKDILYNRAGGFEVLADLSNSLQYAIENPEDKEQIAQHTNQCRTYHKMFETAVAEEQIAYEESVNNLDTAPAIKKLFHEFINPTYSCSKVGAYWSLALVKLNWAAGAEIAYCSSTLGESWIELRPFADHGVGVGAYLGGGMSYGWDDKVNYTSLPVSITPRASVEVEGAKLVGGKVSSYRQLMPNNFGVGLGIGAKAVANIGAQVNVTVFSFKNNFESMIKVLTLSDLKEREVPEDEI